MLIVVYGLVINNNMKKWIALFETEESPEDIVNRCLHDMIYCAKDSGHAITPHEINNGMCYEFADTLERMEPAMFQSMDMGGILSYGGEYDDDPQGFDEELLAAHWKGYQPFKGLTWKQMFHDVGLNWPGTHAWGYCKTNGLCYDAETTYGVQNPFDLKFFDSWKQHAVSVMEHETLGESFTESFKSVRGTVDPGLKLGF